jgi:hypothetical protein
MDLPFLIPIATALIGAGAGIVGGGLTGARQARLEREKWGRSISDTFNSELRSSVKELTTKLAEASHSMCWLCWLAKHGSEQTRQVDQERITDYDRIMHVLLPQILGLHAIIAGMDYEVYLKLKPLVERLFYLDFLIGNSTLLFTTDRVRSIQGLAAMYKQVLSAEQALSGTVAEAIRPYSISARGA